MLSARYFAGVLLLSAASIVNAQTFYSVPALSFTKAFAGANPLSQTVMVSSTGAAFNYTAVASTSSGGSWLQILPGSGVLTTPSAVAVSVNDSTSLAAGTYTGQIVFSSYPTPTITMTVPVTLIVSATGTPYFGDTAGQLTFSLTPGAGNPPQQQIQIRNGGSGTLNWSGSVSTSDGGNWLSMSAGSGNAPSDLTVTVQTGSLPGGGATSGTFVGQLLFQASGTKVTIPVSVTVGTAIFRQVNPISFSMPFAGLSPLPQVLTLASTGTAFNFYIAKVSTGNGGSWLQLNPGSGVLTTPEAVTVSVVNAGTLAAGTYTAEILFWAYPSNNLAVTVPVTLTVGQTGTSFFDNLPGELSFYMVTGGGVPPAQSFQIRNASLGALVWTASASTADGSAWLQLSAASGSAPSTLTASVLPQFLPGAGQVAGSYCGQILLETAGDTGTIPVCMVVGTNVFRQVNPINFTMPFAGANPLPQTLTLASTGTNFNFYVEFVSTGTGGPWLKSTPSSGVLTTSEAVTISINATTLPAGIYTGQIIFSSYPSNNMALAVPVTLTVAASGSTFFDNLPGELSFTMIPGGSPPAQGVQIRSGGGGTLNWTASGSTADGGNWLTISPPGGTTPGLLTVGIVPASLPGQGQIAGTYCGAVLLQTSGDAGTIPVCVIVGPNVFAQVNPINFTMTQGGPNPLTQTLNIASTGSTNFNFYSTFVSSGTGGNWLAISPSSGVLTTPEAINVTVNATTLAAGTYSGEIVFSQYPSNTMALTVPVTLTVAPASSAYLDNLPGQLSFTLAPGGKPPAQSLQIRNGGTGPLSWTASRSTADGGSWLTVSPASGNAPTNVSVSVNPSSLPGQGLIAGTYCGQVVFKAAGDTGTVPVCVLVGANVFRQVNPLNFTTQFGGGNPLPQVLTLASTGTNFNFYITSVSTSKGGSWLTVSPNSGVLTTPDNIVATVNASGLAAGTYTAEVVFAEYPSNNMSLTVPVTLTVSSCGPSFDSVQGQVSFSFAPSSTNPAPQAVHVRPAGWGKLNWTAGATTSDGGAWLTVSPKKGSAPSTLSVAIVNSALPGSGLVAGTFTGQVVLQASGGNVTIPVSVNIGANVFSPVIPLTFNMTLGGGNPPSQNLTVASTGSAFSFYFDSIATGNGGSWLQLSPNSGVQTTPKTVTASVSGASLLAGTYTGQVVLSEYPSNTMTMTVPVIITVTDPHTPASVTATSGTPQSAVVTKSFAHPLVATVKDAGGNPVSGVLVTFNVPASGASATFACSGNTAITNSQGVATSQVLTANTVAGRYSINATANSLRTTPGFVMTNKAGPPASVAATAGTPQSATVNTAFAVNLAATVKDFYGNPVAGATVMFQAPGSGASGTFAGGVNTATTNAQGVATAAAFTANTTAGSYTVTATVGRFTTNPGFLLTNVAGNAASIVTTAGTPQSAVVNTAFATNLAATVRDSFGNFVSGVTVTFHAPGSGASGTFAGGVNTAVTNGQGLATAVAFTANSVSGSYTVTATAGSAATNPGFSLTNLAAGATSFGAPPWDEKAGSNRFLLADMAPDGVSSKRPWLMNSWWTRMKPRS